MAFEIILSETKRMVTIKIRYMHKYLYGEMPFLQHVVALLVLKLHIGKGTSSMKISTRTHSRKTK